MPVVQNDIYSVGTSLKGQSSATETSDESAARASQTQMSSIGSFFFEGTLW